jgi:hypothetical protein
MLRVERVLDCLDLPADAANPVQELRLAADGMHGGPAILIRWIDMPDLYGFSMP